MSRQQGWSRVKDSEDAQQESCALLCSKTGDKGWGEGESPVLSPRTNLFNCCIIVYFLIGFSQSLQTPQGRKLIHLCICSAQYRAKYPESIKHDCRIHSLIHLTSIDEHLLYARHLAKSRVEPQQNFVSAFTEFTVQCKIRKPVNN